MISRRDFISLLTVAGLSPLVLNSKEAKDIDGNRNKYYFDENPENYKQKSSTRILPNALRPGSKIAITAPASPTSLGEIAGTIKILKNLGCSVEVGDTIKNKTSAFRYLSNSDDTRAKEFMDFVERKDIDCILCGRGGYGVMRILNLLDFEKIKNNPKIIMGFSDITALINSIYNISGLVSFHGPVASTPFDNFTLDYFKKVVYQSAKFSPVQFHSENITIINKGEAEGKLVGGNLRMLISTLGTPYEINTEGSILFIEEVSESAYQIDRMLTQLILSGKLTDCNGIILGQFKDLDKRTSFFPTKSFTIREVLEQVIIPLKIPAIYGMPFGHIQNKLTLPIGTQAELNANKKNFSIVEPSVIYTV